MASSNHMNDNLKDKLDKVLTFIKQNIRYFTAGALFIVLVFVLVCFGVPQNTGDGENVVATETETQTVASDEFQVDAYPEVNDLINRYYTAYADGDNDTLETLATPLSDNEKSYITVFSQYVDGYQNVKCYTKQGLDAKSYLVSVYVEIKFTDVDTVAPGLDFFYVRTNDDGSLYIDNLYSQYNLKIQENALDTSVQSLISEFESGEDVIALQQEVQEKYDQAVASDEKLAAVISTTIPNAVSEWAQANRNSEETETPEEAVTEETEIPEETETQVPEETETTEENGGDEQTQETVYALDTVNVRAQADTSAEKLGSLGKGTAIARTGTEGEWSIVDYGGTTGYIMTEYLTTDRSQVPEDEADADETDTSAGSLAEGTVVRLSNTVNIRSSMSETADRIGTAYAGEEVTVVMSYAEGWTRVTWNGETGYIKTSLLQ